jgi:hypothetical protein
MAVKKKTMKGGKVPFTFSLDMFRRSPKKQENTIRNRYSDPVNFSESIVKTPTTNIEKNKYLSVINKMKETYQKINSSSFPVNQLESKVKAFISFSKQFRKYNDPSLDDVKRILIEKIIDKINGNKNLTFAELLDLLIIFKNLSNQIDQSIGIDIYTSTNIILNRLQTQLHKEIHTKTNIQDLIELIRKLDSINELLKNGNTILKNNIEHLKYILNQRIQILQQTKPHQNNSQPSMHQQNNFQKNRLQQTGPNQTNHPQNNFQQTGLRQNNFQQTGLQQNSSQQFQVNNRPNKLKQSLKNTQNGYTNHEKIREIANQIFELLSRKFDLAIEFLDTIGNSRIKKGYNNSLVNNAVYENKDLAKNIRILYDLWIEFTKWNSKYLSSFTNADKSKLENQATIIEDKKQVYSQKMLEKQKYVNYTK